MGFKEITFRLRLIPSTNTEWRSNPTGAPARPGIGVRLATPYCWNSSRFHLPLHGKYSGFVASEKVSQYRPIASEPRVRERLLPGGGVFPLALGKLKTAEFTRMQRDVRRIMLASNNRDLVFRRPTSHAPIPFLEEASCISLLW